MTFDEIKARLEEIDEQFLSSGPPELLHERTEILHALHNVKKLIAQKSRSQFNLERYRQQTPELIEVRTVDQMQSALSDATTEVERATQVLLRLEQEYKAKLSNHNEGK